MDILTKIFTNRFVLKVTSSTDLMLAVFILSAIGILILPMPSAMLDALIGLNFTISITLVMLSLYIPTAVKFSAFPSILLVTTLFRLSVNVAASRQILLQAFAGNIIAAFGNFVVGGNYIVGVVTFILITIVQFLVIVKGTERVAEVAARFALDSLPGQQMAIEADMRSGLLNSQQAKEKRRSLEIESQLYGSLDGALKFVKGDSIAGLIITVVNIIGGLAVGVFMHGMDVAAAFKTYILLTVGQGLVSQIPAFIISFTAGIITTRVTSTGANLGAELSKQLTQQPRALLLTGGTIFALSTIPGFPWIIFIPLAAIIATCGIYMGKTSPKTGMDDEASSATPSNLGAGGVAASTKDTTMDDDDTQVYTTTIPVILELGSAISKHIMTKNIHDNFMEVLIPQMRAQAYNTLGVACPGIHIKTNGKHLKPLELNLLLNEIPSITGSIVEHHFLVNATETSLQQYNIAFMKLDSVPGIPQCWVPISAENILKKVNITYWNIEEVLILYLNRFYRKHAADFIGIQETKKMVSGIEESYPDLVKEVARLLSLHKLSEIFKRLIQEDVSVKDIRTIFETLLKEAQSEKDPVMLTELLRSSMSRYLTFKYSLGNNRMSVYLIDPALEDTIRASIQETSTGTYLAMDPDVVQAIVQSAIQNIPPPTLSNIKPVILTTSDIRRFIYKLLSTDFPGIAVLSYQEILPTIQIQPVGKISI